MSADEGTRDALGSDLARLAKFGRTLDPSDVRPVIQSLAAAFQSEKDPERRGHLARILVPMAERLGSDESTRICRAAAERLSSDWTRENGFDPGQEWIRGLGEMMVRLPMDSAVRIARLVATAANSADRNTENVYDT